MKTLYAFIVCLFVLIAPTWGQVCPVPEPIDQQAALGIWQGHYTENGIIRNLKIDLRELSGRLVSIVDMPDHGLANAKLETTICSAMELHIKQTRADNMTLELTGKPKGDKMVGRFVIGDICKGSRAVTFSLVKTGSALSLK